jgi:superfamily II DNA or RNA helicase
MPFEVVENVETAALELLDQGIDLARIVLFAEHPTYTGYLQIEPVASEARGAFLTSYRDWVSRHLVLNGLHLLDQFIATLHADGYATLFTPSTKAMLEDHQRWSAPLAIEGYELRAFQNFGLNHALERARQGATHGDRLFFWNWSAGAGKSFCSGAAVKALLDSGDVDLVIACTLSKLKENLKRTWVNDAGLNVMINDHAKPATRRARYAEAASAVQNTIETQNPNDGGGVQAFVMNFEKLWVDFDALADLTAGKRVLFVLDEAHKVIAESGQNKARKALDKLVRGCEAIVWPMSATVVGGNPLRFRDVFSLDSYPRDNPLGSKQDFVDRYAEKVTSIPIKAKNGGQFTLTRYDWDLPELHEVRHRVGDRMMAVRKTEPGIKEQFKGIQCIPEWVPMTSELEEINEIITADARESREKGESRAPHYLAMRLAAINPAVLAFSDNEIAQKIWTEHRGLCVPSASNKLEMLNDRLDGIREGQDKAVVFCHWTQLGILPMAPLIKVPHVLHYGTGQTDKASQKAQDDFKTNPDITCFLTSDAGTHGLNFQEARYVISVDPLYSYDDLTQRNSRIDRADSHLDGLTAYIMITEGSKVEERIWQVCEARRQLAEAVQGTREELSYGDGMIDVPESGNIDWLIGLDD